MLQHVQAVAGEELDAATSLLDDSNGGGLPVKKLLLLVEMARQRSSQQIVPFDYLEAGQS